MHHQLINIQGSWSDEANGWVSEITPLTGDSWLEVNLPQKGRVVIKKSETPDGPFPKALISKWSGPKFRIRIFHGTYKGDKNPGYGKKPRYIQIVTTETPDLIQLTGI